MTANNTKRLPSYIGGIFAIIAGFFFITMPEISSGVIGILFGVVLFVAGLSEVIGYIISIKQFREENYGKAAGAEIVLGMDDILTACRMDLPWARMLMDDFFSHLNIVLRLIRAVLDPHCIILGGDIPDALRQSQLLPPTGEYVLGARFEESCALGAAAIARHRELFGI